MNTLRTNQRFNGIVMYDREEAIVINCKSIFDMILHIKKGIESKKKRNVYAVVYSSDRRFLWAEEEFSHKAHWNSEDIYKITWLFNRAFGLRGTISENDDGTYDYSFKVKRKVCHIHFDIDNQSFNIIEMDDDIGEKIASWMLAR